MKFPFRLCMLKLFDTVWSSFPCLQVTIFKVQWFVRFSITKFSKYAMYTKFMKEFGCSFK